MIELIPSSSKSATGLADQPPGSAKIRVFVFDDHTLVRRGLVAMVDTEDDMEVCGEADNAADAVKKLEGLKPDIAIVDVSRKRSSGTELIKAIHALNLGIRVVALSMCSEASYASQILRAGALAYVMKQDVTDRILDAIRRARKGKGYVSKNVAGQVLNEAAPASSQQPSTRKPPSYLDEIEREIVGLIGLGLPARGIAERLNLSVKMVEAYRRRIRNKLNFPSATQLVQFCVCWVENKNAGSISSWLESRVFR